MAAIKDLPKQFDIKKQMTDFIENSKNSTTGVGKGDYLVKHGSAKIPFPMTLVIPDLPKFQAHRDDVAICGIAKSGASRFSALVGMIMHDANPVYLYQEPDMQEKVPWLEFCTGAGEKGPRGIDQISLIPSPRAYWTRLAFDGLPPSVHTQHAKVVYHLRHPKDTLVTLYHNYMARKATVRFSGNISTMVDYLVTDEISCGPWFDHMASYWAHRDDPDVHICSFEDFSQKPTESIIQLANFLGKNLTDTQVKQIAFDCHWDQMSKNPMTNHESNAAVGEFNFNVTKFMRSGVVGGWKEHIDSEQNERINTWMKTNLQRPDLAGIAERFPSTFATESV
ncbi:putative Sulfotransferase 1C2 [Hypsibius exemplaris]|uniref:Sulfotransferase 1C2 n=1 Tax=Hypsibius exemplaris TaxID=2072580 RepID=A0A1W0WT04_HYPEX|nr:putative Sulfotransferase 1C2 [Hypsibius exemplaris]